MGLVPIYKKNRPTDHSRVLADVDRRLRNFAAEFSRQASTYPPDIPLARYYRRTGDLGRFWVSSASTAQVTVQGGSRSITIINRVVERRSRRSPYARFVQGNKSQQARLMQQRGWVSAIAIAHKVWEKYKPALQNSIKQV